MLRYRMPGQAKRPEFKLGSYPALGAVEARQEALSMILRVARGESPLAERERNERQRAPKLTVADLCQRFRDERMVTMAPKTTRSYGYMITGHVLNADYGVGALAVSEVEKRDLQALLNAISEQIGRTGLRKVGQAKKVRGFLKTLFNYAAAEGLRDGLNCPLGGIHVDARRREWERPLVRRVRYVFEPEEVPLVWRALAVTRMPEAARDALRLIAWTGVRKDEARTLTWGDVRLGDRYPHLEVRRHKNENKYPIKHVPLSTGCVEMLKSRGIGLPGAFVFASPVDAGKPIGDIGTPWSRARKRFGAPAPRIHDLRGLAAAQLMDAGWTEAQIQRFIGWDSIEMVRLYVGASKEMKQRGAEILDLGLRRAERE